MCVCMFTFVCAYVPMVSQRSKADAGIFFSCFSFSLFEVGALNHTQSWLIWLVSLDSLQAGIMGKLPLSIYAGSWSPNSSPLVVWQLLSPLS